MGFSCMTRLNDHISTQNSAVSNLIAIDSGVTDYSSPKINERKRHNDLS
jgi:hypothetical protein